MFDPTATPASTPASPAPPHLTPAELTELNPHKCRTREILKTFPQVRQLYGTDSTTQFYAYAVIAFQCSMAYLLSESYFLAFASALTFGPYGMMCILVFLHEASHNLIFKDTLSNRLLGNLTNIPMLIPIFEVFKQHHNAHHNHLGDAFLDVDTPLPVEVQLVGSSTFKKCLWLIFNPAILALRSLWKLPVIWNRFLVLNFATCLGSAALLLWFYPPAFLYLMLSTWLSQSIHPSNARVVQRHVANSDGVRRADDINTYSYYGPMNLLTLNVGYHIEHHDFSRIPYSNLPALRKICGEKWYPTDNAHQTRGFGAVAKFLFDERCDLTWFNHVH